MRVEGLQRAEVPDAGRKRAIRLVSGVFIVVLLAFTLLSNTLLTMALPKVTTEAPHKGELMYTFHGGGVLRPRLEAALGNKAGWRVRRILVREGDAVVKGQRLIVYDDEEAMRSIQNEQDQLRKQELALGQLQSQYVEASRSGGEEAARSAARDIESARIDLGVAERNIQGMQDDWSRNRELVAPFDGVVTRIGAVEGLASSAGGSDVLVASRERGFELELQVPPALAALLRIGEETDVQVNGGEGGDMQVTGHVADIREAPAGGGSEAGGLAAAQADTPPQRAKRVLIALPAGKWKGGEQAEVRWSKAAEAGETVVLVSNKAIHDGSDGKYVYKLTESKGPLGNVYTVHRAKVEVGDANERETAVRAGLFAYESVIVDSSEPLQDGQRVRLE